jgi:hypothetical protein
LPHQTLTVADFFSFCQSVLFLDSTRKCSILRGLHQNNIPENIETLSEDEMRRCYRFTLNEIGQILPVRLVQQTKSHARERKWTQIQTLI